MKTALYNEHLALHAKIVDFHGFELPLQYSSIIAEHMNVRENCGLFDISHMGKLIFTGTGAFEFLQYTTTNDISNLKNGDAQYNLLLNEAGGIVDDIVIQKMEGHYLVIVNAANIDADLVQWNKNINEFDVIIDNISLNFSLLALQGSQTLNLLKEVVDAPLENLGYYKSLKTDSKYGELVISRLGYTGEDGFEIMLANSMAVDFWRALLNAGTKYKLLPIGLGARDTLRLEAGYYLHGSDITPDINPIEASLKWVLKLDKGDFVGKIKLSNFISEKKIYPLILEDKGIARSGYKILDANSNEIGVITSGNYSPILKKSIALGIIHNKTLKVGDLVFVNLNNKICPASISKSPFIKIEKPLLKKA